MSHFAQIDDNNIVVQVIVAEQAFIDSGAVGDPSRWIQTSYNTRGGVHYNAEGHPDGGVALRKNYAGIGYSYDRDLDAFIPPKPFPSWILNRETGLWDPPIPLPPAKEGVAYEWNEEQQQWDERTVPVIEQPLNLT